MITTEELSRFPDTFNGDDEHLVRCIEALLSLDATGTLVPHGIGGHARGLLSAAMHRLASQSRAAGVRGAGDESARLAALWDSEAAKLERGGVNQPNYDKGLASGLRQCSSNLRDSISRQSRLATLQPPKDAGAVPLPELERFTHEIVPADKPYVHMAHDRSGNWCLYRDAIRYGNAREAAGRADAAPDPLDAAIAKGTKAWAGVPDSFVEDLRGEPAARAQVAGDGGLVDPLHLKKLYAVRRFVQSQMEIPKGVSLDSRRFLIQIIDADIEQIKAFSDTSPSPAHAGAGDADTKRLDALLSNSWDLRCFNIPTPGGDDADIGWRVIEHHLGEPRERVVGEIYKDDPRAAIDAARRLAGGDHAQ